MIIAAATKVQPPQLYAFYVLHNEVYQTTNIAKTHTNQSHINKDQKHCNKTYKKDAIADLI